MHSFTLFFLFREGESSKFQVAAFLPLEADQFERMFAGISGSIVANVWPWARRRDPNELGFLGAWSAVSYSMWTGNSSLFLASDRWLICSMGTRYDGTFHFRALGNGLDFGVQR